MVAGALWFSIALSKTLLRLIFYAVRIWLELAEQLGHDACFRFSVFDL
jgi:hypothetical protein